MDELLTIGAFARLTRLTPKALRLYDELGLLPPVRVDPASGYRYYEPAQLERARLVASSPSSTSATPARTCCATAACSG
jgi:protein phosphatase